MLLRPALLLLVAACASPAAPHDAETVDPEPLGPPYLQAYKDVHYEALGDRFVAAATEQELIDEISGARVLFLGDYHEDPALHARMRRLLARLVGERSLTLAVEFLGREDEDELAEYLAGRSSLARLRQRHLLRVGDSWLESDQLDRDFYADLLRFARQHRVPMHALEPVPRLPLDRRDRVIADRIRALAGADPDRLVVAILGHAHLLGEERVVALAGMRSVVIGARLSRPLALDRERNWREARDCYLRSAGGAWFFAGEAE
jgi:hypothetical protein